MRLSQEGWRGASGKGTLRGEVEMRRLHVVGWGNPEGELGYLVSQKHTL